MQLYWKDHWRRFNTKYFNSHTLWLGLVKHHLRESPQMETFYWDLASVALRSLSSHWRFLVSVQGMAQPHLPPCDAPYWCLCLPGLAHFIILLIMEIPLTKLLVVNRCCQINGMLFAPNRLQLLNFNVMSCFVLRTLGSVAFPPRRLAAALIGALASCVSVRRETSKQKKYWTNTLETVILPQKHVYQGLSLQCFSNNCVSNSTVDLWSESCQLPKDPHWLSFPPHLHGREESMWFAQGFAAGLDSDWWVCPSKRKLAFLVTQESLE